MDDRDGEADGRSIGKLVRAYVLGMGWTLAVGAVLALITGDVAWLVVAVAVAVCFFSAGVIFVRRPEALKAFLKVRGLLLVSGVVMIVALAVFLVAILVGK